MRPQLKRHRDSRRLATLVATVTHLEASATDDALELLELLWATELAGKARTEADKGVVKKHPRLAKASAVLAVVAQVLLEARTWGEEEEVRVAEVWEAIEARIAREQVRAAVDTVTGMLPPPEAAPEGRGGIDAYGLVLEHMAFWLAAHRSLAHRTGARPLLHVHQRRRRGQPVGHQHLDHLSVRQLGHVPHWAGRIHQLRIRNRAEPGHHR
jgi:hypothetical protein